MRIDINYYIVGVIGELFIGELCFPYGLEVKFGLTSKLEDAQHLSDADILIIRKKFKNKIEIKKVKIEVID